jgi:hypothetical protein
MSPYCWGLNHTTFYGRNKFCNIVSLLMLVDFYRSDKYTGATTLSITTLSTIGLFDTLSITTLPLCWMLIWWVTGFIYCYAECHCDECRYAECSDANTIIAYYATELIMVVKSFMIQTLSLVDPSLYTGRYLGAPSFFMGLALEAPSSIWVFILMSPLPCCSLSLYEPLYFSSLFFKGPLSWCSSLLKGLFS